MADLDTLYEERREAEDALAFLDDDIADSTVGYAHGGFDATSSERAAMLARKNRIEAALVALDAEIVVAEAALDAERAAAEAAEARAELAAARYALERHQCDMVCFAEEASEAELAEMEEEEKRLSAYVDELEAT